MPSKSRSADGLSQPEIMFREYMSISEGDYLRRKLVLSSWAATYHTKSNTAEDPTQLNRKKRCCRKSVTVSSL
jgi:hypothetical protein